jgi:hypothetical protein
MRRSEPTRELLPTTPRPGVEVVYKRFSRLPQGAIVCTVSYLESKKPVSEPVRKKTLLLRIVGVWNRLRGGVRARLSRLRAHQTLRRALNDRRTQI